MVRNIHRTESQILSRLFAGGGKFLVVPLDFAKAEHTAQCCIPDGDYVWKRPLRVWNNLRGVDFLLERVAGVCRKLRIKHERVVFAGEDPSSFALPFVEELMRRKASFVRVRATKAAEHRKSSLASSDNLDLDGIAHAVMKRFASDMEECDGLYARMRLAVRSRAQAVKQETGTKSRIHQIVDRLFPGFLDDDKSGIHPFGPACLEVLKDSLTPKKVLAMKPDKLAAWLKKRGVWRAAATAEKLQALASTTVQAADSLADSLRESLSAKIVLLQAIRAEIASEENEMARCLIQTPGTLLTSIPGIGLVYASTLSAEYGDPRHWRRVKSMFAYAGCAQSQKQSGGPDKQPVQQGMPMSCNHRLKDCLLQAAFHAGTTPHQAAKRLPGLDDTHRLMRCWQALDARGGHTRLGTARTLLRIMHNMMQEKRIYLPDWWLQPEKYPAPEPAQAAAWLDAATTAMEQKWQGYNFDGIPDEVNQLKIWRKNADELINSLTAIPF